MRTALYFERLGDDKVRCTLCPHECKLKIDQIGICRVRSNRNGNLVSENYGKISSIHLDPIEKKPLYHFYPGREILSIGSIGCNLQCNFCQNCEISQTGIEKFPWAKDYSPEDIVKKCIETPGNIGIAFTYNEPVIFFEYMLEIAKLSKERGLKNVMVSNGFINPEPLGELLPWIDAFNIDLKAFSNDFYRKQTHSQLEPVKRCLKQISESGKHLEITNLIIPGLNDDEKEFKSMVKWISEELGEYTVFHISRYFPRYKAQAPPTKSDILLKFRTIALEYLRYVYIGNIDMGDEFNNTKCFNCNKVLIKRWGYQTQITGLSDSGNCINCGQKVVVTN